MLLNHADVNKSGRVPSPGSDRPAAPTNESVQPGDSVEPSEPPYCGFMQAATGEIPENRNGLHARVEMIHVRV